MIKYIFFFVFDTVWLLIVDAGQICASCSDTEGRDTCQHHIECADEEVDAT